MLVDYEYYLGYRRGSQGAIPESDFDFCADRAFSRINRKSFELPRTDPADPSSDIHAPDSLKRCICAVAELLFTQGKYESPESVSSFSNDGYSVSYVNQKKTPRELETAIKRVVMDELDFDWFNRLYNRGVLW